MMQTDQYWHATVHGRVQNVGFRWFVSKTARRLNLAGWVRNNPDGSVEVKAAGPAESLAQFKTQVAQGPAAARVDRIAELPSSSDALPMPFEQR